MSGSFRKVNSIGQLSGFSSIPELGVSLTSIYIRGLCSMVGKYDIPDEDWNSLLDAIDREKKRREAIAAASWSKAATPGGVAAVGPRWMHAKTDEIRIVDEGPHKEGSTCPKCGGEFRVVEMIDSRWHDCKSCGFGERIR